MHRAWLACVLLWFPTSVVAQAPPLPIFPGAEGFGTTTRAAYGGAMAPVVLRVTNLNDSGAGSLRAALLTTTPRVVIFETSGMIALASDITVNDPYVTIAGQTAPSPGITIKGGGITLQTHDVLVEHLRLRPGDGGPVLPQAADHDAIIAYTGSAYNIVFAHNSISWAGGKNTELVSTASPANITWFRNIISEALYHAKNVTVAAGEPSSLGLLVYPMSTNVSMLGNLLAHNSDRNPEAQEGTVFQFVNNVVYDWGHDATWYAPATLFYFGQRFPGAIFQADLVGNKYIAGPVAPPFPLEAIDVYSANVGSQLFRSDNAIDASKQPVTPYVTHAGFDPTVTTPPVPLTGITVRPSSEIEAFVLTNAGARAADRDAVDTRIVRDVSTRTGGMITSQDEVGGWPVLAVNSRPLVTPANPNAVTPSGYTNLEVWLQSYAAAVEGTAPPIPPPTTTTFTCQATIKVDSTGKTVSMVIGACTTP